MLKDLTTTQLSRLIFMHEHFHHFVSARLERLNLDWTYNFNDKSETTVSQRVDLEMFYKEHLKNNSDALERYSMELEIREMEASFDDYLSDQTK
jgi:hypothetical protein